MKIKLDELIAAEGEKFDSKKEYQEKLEELQLELLHQQRLLVDTKRSVLLIFEGPDAAGKGGIIKRIVEKLDPRVVRVWSIVKPTAEEFAHHYLWRFWNKLPRQGELCVFDRSWYGRVLVERVEKFATDEEWSRAYEEINACEKTLVANGTLILKFYLHISKEEQLKRFRIREQDPYKHWKINDEDWRNRRKWDQHNEAAEDMFRETDTKWAPWNVIATDYKWHARVAVMKILVKNLRELFGKQIP